jgi:hypothetical protein
VQGREFDSSTLHLHFGVLAQLVERALSNFFYGKRFLLKNDHRYDHRLFIILNNIDLIYTKK